jgi:hypothetical protein
VLPRIHLQTCNVLPIIHLQTCYFFPRIHLQTCYFLPRIHLQTCYFLPRIHLQTCNFLPRIHLQTCYFRPRIHLQTCYFRPRIHIQTGYHLPGTHPQKCSLLTSSAAITVAPLVPLWQLTNSRVTLVQGSVLPHPNRPLCPRECRGTHCTGSWASTRTGLDVCGKSRLHRDSIP